MAADLIDSIPKFETSEVWLQSSPFAHRLFDGTRRTGLNRSAVYQASNLRTRSWLSNLSNVIDMLGVMQSDAIGGFCWFLV